MVHSNQNLEDKQTIYYFPRPFFSKIFTLKMYKKQASMMLKGTASMLPNNLVIHKAKNLSYAVVHKSVVCLSTVVGGGSPIHKQVACKGESTSGSSTVMQVKWCSVSDRVVLVIASGKGVQMFEQDGSIMIFWHTVSQPIEDRSFSYFARGICSVSNRFICVGTCSGGIMVFDIPPQGTDVKLQETLDYHKVGITDLAASGDKIVSADEDGNIVVWQCGEQCQQIVEIRGAGTPCTSLALWNGLIIAGYSSGHIRIYDMLVGMIKVEICAHSRCINALDIAVASGLLLSVSEDSFVRVWSLPNELSNKVELVFQSPVTDSELCGGRFLEESGQSFALSGYDLAEVVVFGKK